MILIDKIFQIIGAILGHIFKLLKSILISMNEIIFNSSENKPSKQILNESKKKEYEPLKNQDDGFVKGELFENYVREVLFPKEKYKLLERTHSYETNKKDFVASSSKPDFTFLQLGKNYEFYIEAKYRSSDFNDKVKWCEDYQFKRYKKYSQEKPVFIVIGYGGKPNKPDLVYLENIEKIKFTELYLSILKKGEFSKQKEIYEFN